MRTSSGPALLALSLLAATAAVGFERRPLAPDHPALGAWRIELPSMNCFEQMDFRADGTRSVISGKEIATAEFAISATPNDGGYYQWEDKVIEDNGKPDCAGHITPIGDVSSGYMIFSEDGNSFFQCADADDTRCIGPYVRIAGTEL